MSSHIEKQSSPTIRPAAADQYRAAFERLKANKPDRLPKGSLVSQNNVAKEAGTDPSSLKKSRFPLLISEIQSYIKEKSLNQPLSARQASLHARAKNKKLHDRILQLVEQRDHLVSLLCEADAKILELYDRVLELERQLPPSKVVSMDAKDFKQL
ncbi:MULTISPECIES: hypothetical protein [Pseudomonas]|jgi:hypothetical protein|uniref:hypothetical protein n=1 Tax=Pseudomonas TaxID=286 RepID=UPI001E60F502|nr:MULTISPECIES: hypothetical protein [Pseudomonas]MCD4866440.1 hypothetical protein [Pseudomonas sp. PLB05]MDT3721353.1 hypothetical protein [Pseudomonas oryzihabitans]